MKRKYFLVVFFLILAMFLVGCSGVGPNPSITDETQISDLISKLCVAISAKDFDLAKSYCYPGSSAYLMIEQFETMVDPYSMNDVTIWAYPSIYSIVVTGNEATVVAEINIQIWIQGVEQIVDTQPGTTILIKSGGEWYFYY